MAQALVDRYDGEVPVAMEDLVSRARASAARRPTWCAASPWTCPGLPVDTHVGAPVAAPRAHHRDRSGEGRARAQPDGPGGRAGRLQPAADPPRSSGLRRPQAAVRRVRARRLLPGVEGLSRVRRPDLGRLVKLSDSRPSARRRFGHAACSPAPLTTAHVDVSGNLTFRRSSGPVSALCCHDQVPATWYGDTHWDPPPSVALPTPPSRGVGVFFGPGRAGGRSGPPGSDGPTGLWAGSPRGEPTSRPVQCVHHARGAGRAHGRGRRGGRRRGRGEPGPRPVRGRAHRCAWPTAASTASTAGCADARPNPCRCPPGWPVASGDVLNRLDLRGRTGAALTAGLPRPDPGGEGPVAAVQAIVADVRGPG